MLKDKERHSRGRLSKFELKKKNDDIQKDFFFLNELPCLDLRFSLETCCLVFNWDGTIFLMLTEALVCSELTSL